MPASRLDSTLDQFVPDNMYAARGKSMYLDDAERAGSVSGSDWDEDEFTDAAELPPRPSWATDDHRCTTCKGRQLKLNPANYFDKERSTWTHSCAVCLKKRRAKRRQAAVRKRGALAKSPGGTPQRKRRRILPAPTSLDSSEGAHALPLPAARRQRN